MEFARGKHVLLSYNHKSKDVVKIVYETLKVENIPVWFDEADVHEDIYDDMAKGVADAAIVCCFLTPEYESSKYCKLELQQAHTLGKRIIPCMLSERNVWKSSESSWLGFITNSILAVDFSDTTEANIRAKTQQLINIIKNQSSTPVSPKMNWFEPIRKTYLTDHKIRRVMDNGEYPIEKSYINLAMVETKEQHEKEKKLKQQNQGMEEVEGEQDANKGQHNEGILSTYEEIYGVKTSVEVIDIFKHCKDQTRKVLVLGRAGVGKSTFCQYVTYLWAKGELWLEYELVILIILRKLTNDRYPCGRIYSPTDVIEREYFPFDALSNEIKELFKRQCSDGKILWILDGYDEFVQSKPAQLADMFEYVHKKQDHILTSRPYSVDLSYDIKMEIIGFTDENIVKYAEEFSSQMKDGKEIKSSESQKLLSFLQSNPNIWGIAHIPVNLELICTMWIEPQSSKADTLTMTQLYSEITEWFCRRYLEKQKKRDPCEIQNATRKTIFKDLDYCQKEMLFLEHLAYKAMEVNQIMIQSDLLEGIQEETKCSGKENSHVLNTGILKSYEETKASRKIETSKQHYFIHLSFQEYFTARHLLNLLICPSRDDGINFIKNNKYNQRYHFVFLFATGLLTETEFQASANVYWETIEGEPLDLVGLKHTKLMIECVNELIENNKYPQRSRHIQNICRSLRSYCSKRNRTYTTKLSESLQRATALANTTEVQSTLQRLLETNETIICEDVLRILSNTSIRHPTSPLIQQVLSLMTHNEQLTQSVIAVLQNLGEKAATSEVISALLVALRDGHKNARSTAAQALVKIGEKAATSEVIAALSAALRDENAEVRRRAAYGLRELGKKVPTSEVISVLLAALRDENAEARKRAVEALGKLGEKAATSEVLCALSTALRDENEYVRWNAAGALGKLGEKAATSEVISALLVALRDGHKDTRSTAAQALVKLGEKAATTEVISALSAALRDENTEVRRRADYALCELGERVSTSEVLSALLAALRDENSEARKRAVEALGKLGKKASTSEVLCALSAALRDENEYVRWNAAGALGKLGEKAATSEVLSSMLAAIQDAHAYVRKQAAKALGEMGEKAATTEVIYALSTAVRDDNEDVRRNAAESLLKFGKKVSTSEVLSALLTALRDENGGVRRNAAEALGKIGEKTASSAVISALLTALRDESREVRRTAADAFVKLGEKTATSEVLSALLTALRDENGGVRRNAAEALGKLGEKTASSAVISALLTALRDESREVRRTAADAFVKLGEKTATSEVLSALLTALRDENGGVRRNAAEALGKLGEKGATSEVMSALIVAFLDKDDDVGRYAAEALVKFGEKAATSELISVLIGGLQDGAIHVRRRAAEAIVKLGDKAATSEVIAALIAVLLDKDDDVGRYAAEALVKFGEKAATSELISVLIGGLRDNETHVRRRAAEAIVKLGDKAATSEVISALIAVLLDKDDDVGRYAAEALVRLGERARTSELISVVVAGLRDNETHVRRRAAEAIVKLGDKAATSEVISVLVDALRDKDPDVRWRVAEALGEMSEKATASGVISVLLGALRDPYAYVRWRAGEALGKLGEKAATSECVEVLLIRYCEVKCFDSDLHKILQRGLVSYDALRRVNPDFIRKLCRYVKEVQNFFQGSVALDSFLRLFLDTGNKAWLEASFFVAATENIAVVVNDGSIRVYDGSKAGKVLCAQSVLLEAFIKEFGLLKENFLNSGE